MADAFYEAADGGYVATELTRGPWDPGAQHAGPPSALLGREIERVEGGEHFQVARVSIEILRPVPIGPLEVEARLARPGRSVQMIEASLKGEEGALMMARAWRIRTIQLDLPEEATAVEPPPPGPEGVDALDFFPTGQAVGYHSAMEGRAVGGSFVEPGPATVWMRMRHPLVAGEEPSPLQRTLIVADVGNGISAVLDWRRFIFVNVDLTVHLERLPTGEWVCIDSATLAREHGVGTTESVLFDRSGRIGRAAQSLLIAER